MKWYYIVLIIFIILILLMLVTSYICYKMAFYNNTKKKEKDDYEVYIPNDEIYECYKEVIINDIKDVEKLEGVDMYINSFDGLKLHAKYYENIKGAPIEIMFHGYRGSARRDMSTGLKRAFKCGHNALLISQRTSGKSEGHTISFGINESKDCLRWIDLVIKTFGNDVKIIICGVSMGAATVVTAAGYDLPKNVIGVLADCGFDTAEKIIKKTIKEKHLSPAIFYPFVKLGARIYGKFNIDETSPLEACKKTKLPILFIHGDNDTFVPCSMSENMFNHCVSEKKKFVTIKNAGHAIAYLVDPENYIKEVVEFFN